MTTYDLNRNPVEEMLHGTIVRDPYRWLEDASSPETRAWVQEQQNIYEDYFGHCDDLKAIRKRVQNRFDGDVFDQPMKIGRQYFYRRRNSNQEHACLYVRDGDKGAERLLVDPSRWGPYASVAIQCIAQDGSLLAFGLRQGGEDQISIHFLKVGTGEKLLAEVETAELRGLVLLSDNSGFVYCQKRGPDKEPTIVLHTFHGSTDEVIFRVPRLTGTSLTVIGDTARLGAFYQHYKDDRLVADFFFARMDEPRVWTR